MLSGWRVMSEDKTRARFGRTLKDIRKRRGLSQFQLAIKLGKTPSKIAQYEVGKRNPTRRSIAEIATTLKATPDEHDELLMAAGFMPEHIEIAEDATAAVRLALRGHKHISEEDKQRILDIVAEIEARQKTDGV